ncbi:hypothetical protein GCM10017667_08250 [Streptomyces filamentosus]|uniref:Uncharacterized protein n=1 Tax=Streptomyces filamentosus TaxID=67294 RepID=A0A919BD45_STRFL|nr:hypothetical protein GCM10017667_08250 [Streptomyces filamentosus]
MYTPPVGDGAGRGAGRFAAAFFAGARLAGAAFFAAVLFAGGFPADLAGVFAADLAAVFFAAPAVRPARDGAVPWEPLPDVREAMVLRLPVRGRAVRLTRTCRPCPGAELTPGHRPDGPK